jgi:hypothetical protein
MKKRGGLTKFESSIESVDGRLVVRDDFKDGPWPELSRETLDGLLDRIEGAAAKAARRWPESEILERLRRIREAGYEATGAQAGNLIDAYGIGFLAAHTNIGRQKSLIGRRPAAGGLGVRGRPPSKDAQPESVKRRLRRSRARR